MEAISDFKLRHLGTPAQHAYILPDEHGERHIFSIYDHPATPTVFASLRDESFPADVVRALGLSSAHGHAISDMLQKGAPHADGISILCQPPYLELAANELRINPDLR